MSEPQTSDAAPDVAPDVPVTPPIPIYLERLEVGKLPYQACIGCGNAFFYPRLLCPACGGTDVEFRDSAGAGTVYTRTVIHVRDGDPYNVVLVDLDEGFRIMSCVEDVANDDLKIGMKVALKTIYPAQDGAMPKPVFKPAEGGQ